MAWLDVNRPARSQWYERRNRPLTGCTALHTAEGVLDSVGPDTGAENVARFIQGRSTAGSYHDLVDSDSGIYLIDYVHGAFHDGTGSNNWALSLSFACATHHWPTMSATQRKGFLRQGAIRFAHQQLWRKANRAPLTRLRYITKAQSDAGESGFTCHGWRDPGRRTDPGIFAPNLFPFDEFLAECRLTLAELMPDHPDAAPAAAPPTSEEDDMQLIMKVIGTKSTYWVGAGFCVPVQGATLEKNLKDSGAKVVEVTQDFMAGVIAQANRTA